MSAKYYFESFANKKSGTENDEGITYSDYNYVRLPNNNDSMYLTTYGTRTPKISTKYVYDDHRPTSKHFYRK
jgi:hypothetical protein